MALRGAGRQKLLNLRAIDRAVRGEWFELGECGSGVLAITRNGDGFRATEVLAIADCDHDDTHFGTGTASDPKRLVQGPTFLADPYLKGA